MPDEVRQRNWLAPTVAVVLLVTFAAVHLLLGVAAIVQASWPRTEVANNPLLPPLLDELNASARRYDLVEGQYALSVGVALALASVLVWKFRNRLVPVAASAGAGMSECFRRYALYSIGAACLGAIASPIVHGVVLISPVLTRAVSLSLMLVGFGASVVALAVAREARIRFADSFVEYALAACGALLSGGFLAWMLLDMTCRAWRYFQ